MIDRKEIAKLILNTPELYNYMAVLTEESWGLMFQLVNINGTSSGTVYWYYDEKDCAYIANLNVDESSRNRGLGIATLSALETVAVCLNASKIILEVVSNSWQHQWYNRKGYYDYVVLKKESEMSWLLKPINKSLEIKQWKMLNNLPESIKHHQSIIHKH